MANGSVYCPQCGHENSGDARFCMACGTPLQQRGAAVAPTPDQNSAFAALPDEAFAPAPAPVPPAASPVAVPVSVPAAAAAPAPAAGAAPAVEAAPAAPAAAPAVPVSVAAAASAPATAANPAYAAAPATPASPAAIALDQELRQLQSMREAGLVSQETYEASRAQAMAKFASTPVQPVAGVPSQAAAQDTGGIGWAVLGFFIPLAGLILYLVWKDERPLSAKSAGKGAIVGVIVNVVVSIIAAVASVAIPMAMYGSMY